MPPHSSTLQVNLINSPAQPPPPPPPHYLDRCDLAGELSARWANGASLHNASAISLQEESTAPIISGEPHMSPNTTSVGTATFQYNHQLPHCNWSHHHLQVDLLDITGRWHFDIYPRSPPRLPWQWLLRLRYGGYSPHILVLGCILHCSMPHSVTLCYMYSWGHSCGHLKIQSADHVWRH